MLNLFNRRSGRHHSSPSDNPTAESKTPADSSEKTQQKAAGKGQKTAHQLHATGAHRHLLNTPEGVWAWFVLGEQDIQHKTDRDVRAVFTESAHRWADLVDHEIYLTGVSVPFPVASWAERYDREHPDALPDVPAAPGEETAPRTWEDLLVAPQAHMIALGARKSATVLGVRLSDQTIQDPQLSLLLSSEELIGRQAGINPLRLKLAEVTTAVGRKGFEAGPMASKALGWLMHASLGMGAPVPSVILGQGLKYDPAIGQYVHAPDHDRASWADEHLAGFTNPVDVSAAPFSPTVRVQALRDSTVHDNHVAVLHAEDFAERDLDHVGGPHLAWCFSLPEPVRFVARGVIVDGNNLAAAATLDRRRAKNIAEHWEEHNDDPPPRIERGIRRAKEIEDEVTSQRREVSTRFRGVVMYAVTAATEEDCLQKARDLTALAASQQGITLVHDYGQYAYYRAFTPGEPCPLSGHLTQQPVAFLAAGMPNASTSGGDPTGFPVGNIAGGHDHFLFDLFGGSRRDKSNVLALGGDQGAGKSSFAAALLDFAASSGIRAIGNDPSGPWAELTKMRHLRGNARHLDLMSARPGTLVPYAMIPEPRPGDHDTTDEYDHAKRLAWQDRIELMIDVVRELQPYGMLMSDTGKVTSLIERTVTEIGGDYHTDPWAVVDRFKLAGEVGKEIAANLEARAQLKDGALIFPPRGKDANPDRIDELVNSAVLTITTLNGLTLPPKGNSVRSTWTRQAQMSVPILQLATMFSTRVMYADKAPKVIMNDELGLSTTGESAMTSLLRRASYDSRKYQALVGLLFQNPNLLLALDDQISNLLGSVFIGRMDATAATGALPLLRLEEGQGWEHEISSLQQGEFVVRHWDSKNRVRRIAVDQGWWHQDLLNAVNTSAGGGNYDESGAELFDGVA